MADHPNNYICDPRKYTVGDTKTKNLDGIELSGITITITITSAC